MEIKTYNKDQLRELISSEKFRHMPVVPISSHRALSHINNPRASGEDTLMIIAFDRGVMLGYLGVLADRLYDPKGNAFKCGWLSCMWVNPELRGKGIAKRLLNTAYDEWNGHILVTEFTPEAKGLYDRSGHFCDLRIQQGLRCYVRFNLHEVLPKKNEAFKPYGFLWKMIDGLANIPVSLRLSLIKKDIDTPIVFEPMQAGAELPSNYIRSKQASDLERRDKNDLNWIVDHPWLKQSKSTEESRRYHFSSVADRFLNLRFNLVEDGVVKGYLHYTIRDNHLKIPYAYFEPHLANAIVQHIQGLMREYKLNMVALFHKELVDIIATRRGPFIYKRNIKRHYIISKELSAHLPDKEKLLIQDGDADCAFT